MLLINQTRAIDLLQGAGFPVERSRDGLVIGLFNFRWARIIQGTKMYSQDAIVQFIKE